jgi:BASS family bile acid:Na+ symporter
MDGLLSIRLLATASILLLVFALGTRATSADATSLVREVFRPPYWLLRALFVMYVVVPAAAIATSLALDLARPIRVGLLAMAIAPIPPILPRRQLDLGGSTAHVIGLLSAVSLVAIVQVPLMVDVLGRVFGRETSFGPGRVASVIGATILIPLTAGLVLRWLAPQWAARTAELAARVGMALLLVVLIAIFINAGPAMMSLLRGDAMLAIVSVAAVAIGTGHWMGGPLSSDRAILAFAAAMRHPGLALAIATANLPEEPRMLAAILLYVLVSLVMTSLYGATMHGRRLRAA